MMQIFFTHPIIISSNLRLGLEPQPLLPQPQTFPYESFANYGIALKQNQQYSIINTSGVLLNTLHAIMLS